MLWKGSQMAGPTLVNGLQGEEEEEEPKILEGQSCLAGSSVVRAFAC